MRKKLNLSDFSFNLVFGIICIFSFLIVAYPLYFVVIASFSSSTMVNQGEVVFWIKDFSIYGYQQILADSRIWIGYRNTLFYSIVGTLINLVVTMPLAYTLSRKEFRFRRPLMAIFVFTMYFSGGLIPSYLLMQKLHLMNTVWVMMIPTAVNVYNLIIARSFMDNLPPELYEASQLDGCSHFTFFCKVVLPLSKAVISVLFLYYFVQHWNDYFSGLMYINDEKLEPLQLTLRNILLRNQAFANGAGIGANVSGASSYAQTYADQIKFGAIIVSTLPLLCIYPFIQKYFEKGVMIGAVKG